MISADPVLFDIYQTVTTAGYYLEEALKYQYRIINCSCFNGYIMKDG